MITDDPDEYTREYTAGCLGEAAVRALIRDEDGVWASYVTECAERLAEATARAHATIRAKRLGALGVF